MKHSIIIFLLGTLTGVILGYFQGIQGHRVIGQLQEITKTLQSIADVQQPELTKEKSKASCSIPTSGDTGTCAPTSNRTYEAGTTFVSGSLTTTQQLMGKPTFLWWAGKFCAYCREKIPQAEKYILDDLSGQVNVQLMTMFFDTEKFSTRIPQVPYETFDYKYFTNKECSEFPMWVVLDSEGKVTSQLCGGEKNIEEIAKELKGLIKK